MTIKTVLTALPLLGFLGARASAAATAKPAPIAAKPVPCWMQAGIDKSVMAQRGELAKSSQAAVKLVCENAAMDMPGKLKVISSIRKSTQEKMDALLTPQQSAALKACNQALPKPPPNPNAPKKGPCD